MQRPEELFIEQKIEFQTRLVKSHIWQSCLNCEHWTHQVVMTPNEQSETDLCGKFRAVPPPHIIVHGCKDHLADVPF